MVRVWSCRFEFWGSGVEVKNLEFSDFGQSVMNGVSLTTLHIYTVAPSYPSVTTSPGAFYGVNTTYSTSVLSKKAPEEVVTDGYEGVMYVQCGQR